MTREIKLTQGQVALVDDEDYDKVMQYGGWYLLRQASGKPKCATRTVTEKIRDTIGLTTSKLKMHHLILVPKEGYIIDHINGNPLDNRKSNLRYATNSQNRQNSASNKKASSKYKGVYWNKDTEKWQVSPVLNGVRTLVGYFLDETTAARAYDKVAREQYGEHGYYNFPEPKLNKKEEK